MRISVIVLLVVCLACVSVLTPVIMRDKVSANPSFTARTETYADLSSLVEDPWDIYSTKPTGTVDGDILFAFVQWYGSTTIDGVPSGWSELGSYTANSDRYALYYKIASGEGSTYTWSFTADCKVRVVCSAYTSGDFDSADPIDVVSNTAYRVNDVTVKATNMTVTSTDSPMVFFASRFAIAQITFTKPSSPTSDWVENDDAGSTTSDFWTEICSMIWTGSGATGDMNATQSPNGATTKHGFAVALNPPSQAGAELCYGYILGG